jgi:hypothetical protein
MINIQILNRKKKHNIYTFQDRILFNSEKCWTSEIMMSYEKSRKTPLFDKIVLIKAGDYE